MDTSKADTQRVVFVGGHSRLARLATPLFVDAGYETRNVVRAPTQTAEIQRLGATSVLMDVEEAGPSDFLAAFDGADVVVFSATVEHAAVALSINAARQAGVGRYILISSAEQDETEAHLRDSGVEYTILRPGELTDGDGTGRITLADAGPEEGASRNNVAAVIAHVVATGAAANETVAFSDGDDLIDDVL